MLSFYNSKELKQKYVDRVKEHQLADEITQGVYWEKGKGCAVGCTIHSDAHLAYETQLGLPKWLARVEDTLFEGMSNADAKQFPLRLLESINVGSDLTSVESKFVIMSSEFALKQFDNDEFPGCTKAIKSFIHLHKTKDSGLKVLREAARAAALHSANTYAYHDAGPVILTAQQEAFKYLADQLIEILKETK